MPAPRKISLRHELRTLFWLQWKLTLAMFRSTRLSVGLRIAGLLLQLLTFVFTIPLFVLMGIGIAFVLASLSPQAAFQVALVINSFMFFIWLVLPASYNSQLMERFEMARLFPHPVSFGGIVIGSTLMSLLTMTGIWTIPIILGEAVGLAWHNPMASPLILLGALPALALFALIGRIMDDLFDLVASDRRLRAVMLAVLMLPFLALFVGQQFFVQAARNGFEQLGPIVPATVLQELDHLDGVGSAAEFFEVLSNILELLEPSRLLLWLPPGWVTAGMGLMASREWGLAFLFLLFSIGFILILLRVHAHVTWRLINGAAVSIGVKRVSRQQSFLNLRGPSTFWALFHKDWLHLKRSPLPRQLLFPLLIIVFFIFFITRTVVTTEFTSATLPLITVSGAVALLSMINNMAFTANYYGAVDREGFVDLAASPVDRRYILLSANLIILLYSGLQFLLVSFSVMLATGVWFVLPLGLCLGLCLQIGGSPAFNLAAIIGPYRAEIQFMNNQKRGNLWGGLAWLLTAPPVLLLIILPYIFWKPGLIISLPLAITGCLGFYAVTLKPLAHLLQHRENAIWNAVISDE